MAVLLAVVIALIPLAIAPGLLFYFDGTPKTALLLLGTAAAVVWWGLAGSPGAARRFTWVTLAMALSLAVSTLVSVNPALSVVGSNWRRWGLVPQLAALALAYLVAAYCAGRLDRLRIILRAIAASSLVTALYGAAQYFGWDPLLPKQVYHVWAGIWTIVRPPSTVGHADYFGNWLLCAVFSSAALLPTEAGPEGSPLGKGLAWSSIVAGCVAVFLSGTRSAILGLAAGAIVLALWRRVRVTRSRAVAAGLVMAATAAFYLSPAGTQLRARTRYALKDRTGGARLLIWRDSLQMALARWPAGYGPETFSASFALRRSVSLARAFPDIFQESPHNMFLEVLAEQGLPGLVFMAAFCVLGFAAAWNLRRNRPPGPPRAVAGALAASLTAMTVSQQFSSFIVPTAIAYYVSVAMLVALGTAPSHSQLGNSCKHIRAAAVAGMLGAILFAVFGVRLVVADRVLALVRRDLDAGHLQAAESQHTRFEEWRVPGPGADLWYSRRLLQVAQDQTDPVVRLRVLDQAELAAQRATKTAEDPFNAWYNLAALFATQNDLARTEQSLRAAIACSPTWFKAHWMLAQVLAAGARLHEAEAEAARAAALDGGKYAEVATTLTQIRAQLSAATRKSAHQ